MSAYVERLCDSGGDVLIKPALNGCSADIIFKDVKLLREGWNQCQYHLMNQNGHYVIVLKHQIIVQTMQPNTPPCKCVPLWFMIIIIIVFDHGRRQQGGTGREG